MFIYWDGFEIDGSDTDFDLVLPENVQLYEFVECFLSLPIFTNTPKPFISYEQLGNRKPKKLSKTQLKEKLLSGDYPVIDIMVICQHPELLSDEMREKVYSISQRREPHEAAFGKTENPCTKPVVQTDFERGNMSVILRILPPGTGHGFEPEEGLNGCVHNRELFRSTNPELPCFQINVGPGFFYEYAIFIIDYLCDHFPSLGVCGGLGCGCGCTYSDSLYSYERILLPVKHSVRNTLKRLTEYDIVRSWSQRYYQKKGWKYEYTDDFYLASQPWWTKLPNAPKPFSFTEYLDLVDMALELDETPFSTVCETAIRILLPQPKEYAQESKVVKELKAALPDSDNRDFTGYFAFTKIEGQLMGEFRVHYSMKKYLLKLLEFAESGAIDFIKPITYERRHSKDE